MEKDNRPTNGYEEFDLPDPRQGSLHSPREDAEAERIRDKSRSETTAGAFRMLAEQIEHERAALLLEGADLKSGRRLAEAERTEILRLKSEQLDLLDKAATASAESLEKVSRALRAQVDASLEQLERSRKAAEILARPPPPEKSSNELIAAVLQHLVTEAAGVAKLVIEGDPGGAAAKLKGMVKPLLGGQESGEPTQPAEPAAEPPPAATPQSGTKAPRTLRDVILISKFAKAATPLLEKWAADHGVELGDIPEDVAYDIALPIAQAAYAEHQAAEQRAAAQASPKADSAEPAAEGAA